jgi:hypothetical protein
MLSKEVSQLEETRLADRAFRRAA